MSAPAIKRAISIRQPWVEQILRGVKNKEFRSTPTNIRERVWLYASLSPVTDPREWKKAGFERGALPTGVIVGSVEIVDCRETAYGDYAYVLRNPKRLRTPLRPSNQPQPKFWRPVFEE